MLEFYRMNWYGFAIGHYMTLLSLGGISIIALKTYVETYKSKNDVRRFQDEYRGKMVQNNGSNKFM